MTNTLETFERGRGKAVSLCERGVRAGVPPAGFGGRWVREETLQEYGAGLTNMMFCMPGAHVVEIAEPRYSNPNFYALACAMGVEYWKVDGAFAGSGDIHRLDRNLTVAPENIKTVLREVVG